MVLPNGIVCNIFWKNSLNEFSFSFFAFFLTLKALFLPLNASLEDSIQNKSVDFFSLRRTEGRAIGNNLSYTTLEAFSFPYKFRSFFPFLDIRYHSFGENGQNASNFGLGFRMRPNFTNFILGANAYYDFRDFRSHSFNQAAVGFEMLGSLWNFRANGYLPVGKKTFFDNSHTFNYTRGYYLTGDKFFDSLKGIDLEAEALLAKIGSGNISFAFGIYYYKENSCHCNIFGSSYRLTINPYNWVSFNLSATHDGRFNTSMQGQITLTVPFPFKKLGTEGINFTLFQPVRRREMILLDTHKRWIWNW